MRLAEWVQNNPTDAALAVATATPIGPAARAIQAADLGVTGSLAVLRGTVALQESTLVVRVDMIQGSVTNAFRAVDGLLSTAAGAGATSVRIEATIANPSLQRVLVERYGAQLGKGPGGAYQDALTMTVKK